MTLRRQFFSLLCALFLAILCAVFAISVSGTRLYLEQQLASHAQDAATSLSVSLGQSMGKGDVVMAQSQVSAVFDRGYFKRIQVLDIDHKTLIDRTQSQKIAGVPLWFVEVFPIETAAGEAFIGSGWKQLGKVAVESQATYAYQHLWDTSVRMLAWLSLIGTVAVVLAHLVLHFIVQPLQAIEKTAVDIQAKRFVPINFSPRAPELARVVSAMNQMSHKVGEMLDEETAKAAALHKVAYQDDLTGWLNRPGYESHLVRLLGAEGMVGQTAVVAVELDDMRTYIREQGYDAGSRLVQLLVDTAQSNWEPVPGVVYARNNEFGFSLIVVGLPLQELLQRARAMHSEFLAHVASQFDAQKIRVHVGVAQLHPSDSRSAVFAKVDLAVESARQSGRHGFFFLKDEADEHCALGSFGWRKLIRSALNEGRWKLVQQRVVRLRPGHDILQHEYMARLVDEHGELVPAARFLPMAARHRLMPEVDRAMVSMALEALQPDVSRMSPIAINLSAQSIVQSDFMEWFSRRLSAIGHRAAGLTVEVPEYGVLHATAAVTALRDLIRHHGGKFGIDHLGLDTQALQLLRDLVPDYVKISVGLALETDDEPVKAMVRSFVKLAHSLDITVIALQVEQRQQFEILLDAGVDAGQGYYFGTPV